MCRLEPHHRIHPRKLGMSLEHGTAEPAVERGESESPSTIVPEDELDGNGAEPAGAVIHQDGLNW